MVPALSATKGLTATALALFVQNGALWAERQATFRLDASTMRKENCHE
jgi:hypothetical protein